jgi:UDP-N-acetylmuramoylalanine-D-glutamate ligase
MQQKKNEGHSAEYYVNKEMCIALCNHSKVFQEQLYLNISYMEDENHKLISIYIQNDVKFINDTRIQQKFIALGTNAKYKF